VSVGPYEVLRLEVLRLALLSRAPVVPCGPGLGGGGKSRSERTTAAKEWAGGLSGPVAPAAGFSGMPRSQPCLRCPWRPLPTRGGGGAVDLSPLKISRYLDIHKTQGHSRRGFRRPFGAVGGGAGRGGGVGSGGAVAPPQGVLGGLSSSGWWMAWVKKPRPASWLAEGLS
jgi:hypothetical protein